MDKDSFQIGMMTIDIDLIAWNECGCEKGKPLNVIPVRVGNKNVKDFPEQEAVDTSKRLF